MGHGLLLDDFVGDGEESEELKLIVYYRKEKKSTPPDHVFLHSQRHHCSIPPASTGYQRICVYIRGKMTFTAEDKELGLPTTAVENITATTTLHEFQNAEGYVIDASDPAHANLKRARDGHTILLPQPSDDPNDPLNWSWFKKHVILIIISMTAFLPDYGSATGAVTLLPQAVVWNMTPDHVNHSQVGNVFMLGAGGVVVVALSAYFGRLPVLFYFVVLATATAIWCAAAQSFESFMAARILNGFFSTVAQGGGLMFLQIFFFHERARKINIWASFIILSPYFGPLFAAFIITTQSWRVPFWVYVAEVSR